MKILMSAFSCGPGRGSEPGVGWNMALEAARLGHEVLVLTQTECKAEIERAVAEGASPANLTFEIFTPRWLEIYRDTLLKRGVFSLTWHTTNILWQFCALHHARKLCKKIPFDLVYHVTMAGIRQPTLLFALGLPTIIGPLGGGERAPMQLRKSFSWKGWLFDFLRDISTLMLRIDPMTRAAFLKADLIFLRSRELLVAVPPKSCSKVHIDVGIGIAPGIIGTVTPHEAATPLKLLYAGRLVHWKGAHLAIRAVAHARSQGTDVTLHLVGSGPAKQDFLRLADQLGIAKSIHWTDELPRDRFLAMYQEHHAFLFPSLHDSASTVILEAFAFGLPVICLDLGGPGQLVDPTCGRSVSGNLNEHDCVCELAREIEALAKNEDLRVALGMGALRRYEEHTWPRVAERLFSQIEHTLSARTISRPLPRDNSRALLEI